MEKYIKNILKTANPFKDKIAKRRDELRNRFKKQGINSLSHEEILEITLNFATPRLNCQNLAKHLLEKIGSLREIFESPQDILYSIEGFTLKHFMVIKFIYEVSGHVLEQRLFRKQCLNTSKNIFDYLRHHMESLDKEIFKAIYINTNKEVIALEDISRGSINGAYVYLRELMERAKHFKASALIVAHNHPNGIAEPSTEDNKLTRKLTHASLIFKIELMDHLIIGNNGEYFSYKDHGYITVFKEEFENNFKN